MRQNLQVHLHMKWAMQKEDTEHDNLLKAWGSKWYLIT